MIIVTNIIKFIIFQSEKILDRKSFEQIITAWWKIKNSNWIFPNNLNVLKENSLLNNPESLAKTKTNIQNIITKLPLNHFPSLRITNVVVITKVIISNYNGLMDNNYAEQAIRPFTVGRKNFVLMESSNGAKASAMIYSIVETAKANQLNVYQYLELLLTEIPKHMDDNNIRFIDDLLPWSPSIQEKCPSKYKKS